jgi:hypothetical protein
MARMTYLALIYVPLSYCSTIFGMEGNVRRVLLVLDLCFCLPVASHFGDGLYSARRISGVLAAPQERSHVVTLGVVPAFHCNGVISFRFCFCLSSFRGFFL